MGVKPPVFRDDNGRLQSGGDVFQSDPIEATPGLINSEFVNNFMVAVEQKCFRLLMRSTHFLKGWKPRRRSNVREIDSEQSQNPHPPKNDSLSHDRRTLAPTN